MTFALLGAQIAGGEQPAEAAIGGAVGGPGGDVGRAVTERKPAADGVAGADLLGREVAAHYAGKRVAVGNCKAGKPERDRRRGQFFREAPLRKEKLDAARSSA